MPITDETKWYQDYDEYHQKCSWEKKILNRLNLNSLKFWQATNKENVILDVACGNGNLSVLLRNRGYKNLHGFDLRKYESPVPELELKVGDMLAMPYPDDFADVILCQNSMHHLLNDGEYEQFMRECRRTLKRCGQMFIIEPELNYVRRFVNVFSGLPLVRSIVFFRIYHDAITEEKSEIEKFSQLNLVELLERHNFKIKLKKSFLKSVVIHCIRQA